MRRKPPVPLVIPPVMLCVALLVVLLLTACGDEDPDPTARALTDAPTAIPDGTELTPAIPPCGEGVPASIVEVGPRRTVVGSVVNARVVDDPEGGETTLLEMGEEGGDVPFVIAIPERAIEEFAAPPEQMYVGEEVCVNGVVQEFQGTPAIFVATDAEIVTTGD